VATRVGERFSKRSRRRSIGDSLPSPKVAWCGVDGLGRASIKSIGVLYYLGALAMGPAGIFMLWAVPKASPDVVLGGAIGVGFAVVMAVCGYGLRRLRRWVRLPVGIFAGLGLLGFPLGTLINGYILYLIFSQKGRTVLSEEYQAVIAATPEIRYRTSLASWIVLIVLILLVVGGIIAIALA
jgi:hypothetical protein